MKKPLLYLFALLLFACGGKDGEDTTDFANLKVSLDTVIVDPGEDIINLKYGIWRSALTSDNRFMYLWDEDAKSMSVINLDELVLDKKVKFNNDGPDGVGDYIMWIQALDNGHLMMADFERYNVFDLQAKKLQEFRLKKEEFGGDSLKEGQNLHRKPVVVNNGQQVYGTLQDWADQSIVLAKVDFENKLVKKYELPGQEKLADYSIMMTTGQMTMVTGSDKNITKVGNKVILSSSAYTDLYVLDMDKDSVYQVSYTPKLTKASKKGGYPKEVDSEKEFRALMRQVQEEINFTSPVWDSEKKRFYRLSYITSFPEHLENEDVKGEQKVFLTVLDENFKVLGETVVEGIKHFPGNPFVKDGKIWVYLNVDDELGFVRISL